MNRSPDARFIVLVYCPSCGSPASASDVSCRGCHAVFEEGACCSHCGDHVNADTDICESCGAAFTTFYEHECPSCRHGVSESAKGCPNCNATFFKPLKRRVNRSSSKRAFPNHKVATSRVEAKREIGDNVDHGSIATAQDTPAAQTQVKDVPVESRIELPNLESSPPSREPQPSPIPQIDVLPDAQPKVEPIDALVLPEEPKKKGLFSFLKKKRPAPQSASSPPQVQPPTPGPQPVPATEPRPEPTLVQLLSPTPEPQPPLDVPVARPAPVPPTPVQAPPTSPAQRETQNAPQPAQRETRRGKFFLHFKSQTPPHATQQQEPGH
jgi:hypothetical protein